MQLGIHLHGDSTVYVFIHDQLYETRIDENKHLQYFNCGFTLDSTGKNLPPINDWKYLKELQPGEILEFPLVEYIDAPDHIEPIIRGLKDKGWYVGRIFYGYEKMSMQHIKVRADALRREYHRVSGMKTPEQQKLSAAAKELLAELLKEPETP
jgi:hypothetical protein